MVLVENPPASAGDVGSVSGSGRSPGGGHGILRREEPGRLLDGASREPARQCRRCGFSLWVRKIPWRRAWHPAERGAQQAVVHGVALKQLGSSHTHTHTDRQTHRHKLVGGLVEVPPFSPPPAMFQGLVCFIHCPGDRGFCGEQDQSPCPRKT